MATSFQLLTFSVRGTISRYALAVALFGVALLLRYAFDPALPPGFPFLTFFPAVIGATFFAGRGPGIVCAVLSGLAAWYWYIPPATGFQFTPQIFTALLFFACVVGIDIALIDGLRCRQAKLIESQQKLEAMATHQGLLFKELQHRVANNLASVASMLRLQRRQIARNPASALDVIDRADARIELMGRVHRQLYDPAAMEIPAADHIARIVEQTREVSGGAAITVRTSVDPVRLEMNRLMTLSLLLSELLTNCFKHAFDVDRPGEVVVRLERTAPGQLCLTVADNGKGCADFNGISNGGLGTAISAGLAAQLGGKIVTDGSNGVRCEVRFPED